MYREESERDKTMQGHQFHYITTSENLIDTANIRLRPKELQENQLQWKGTEWLLESSNVWPLWQFDKVDQDTIKQPAS